MSEIRVLAVRQPWASLIVEGLKTIEVRSKPTNIRGKVAIYASSKLASNDNIGWVFLSMGALQTYEQMSLDDRNKFNSVYETFAENVGKIIGTVEITGVEEAKEDSWSNRREHFAPKNKGKYYWNLANPQKFETPIPYKPPKGSIVWSKTKLQEGIL